MQYLIDSQLASTINLVAQIALLVSLYVGAYYARQRKIRPQHANIQTAVVIINLFLIFFIMAITLYQIFASGKSLTEHPNPFVLLHVIMGLIAELSGIYLVLRMRTKLIPPALRIKNFKRQMQLTLGLWTATAIVGLIIYAAFYWGLGG